MIKDTCSKKFFIQIPFGGGVAFASGFTENIVVCYCI